MRHLPPVIMLAVLLVLSGCAPSSPTGGTGRQGDASTGGPPVAGGEEPGANGTVQGGYIITFSPPAPSVADNVRALLRDAVTLREVPAESWKWKVNGEVLNGESDTLSAGTAGKGDEIEALASVAGPRGTASVRSRKIRVANALPRVIRAEQSNLSPGKSDTLVATPSAEDPDRDPIRLIFRWRINGNVVQEGENPELPLSKAKRGDEVYCEVIPNDGEATGPTLATPIVTVRNSPPILRSTPPSRGGPDNVFSYRLIAEDPDGDALVFAMTEGPKGASFEAGTFRWPPPAEFQGTARVVFRVSDGAGGEARQEFVINVGSP